MRQSFLAICVLGLAVYRANAYTVPEKQSSVSTVFDRAAQDAVYLGHILRNVADALDEDKELSAEGGEYYLGTVWAKAEEAVKSATERVKMSVKGAYKDAQDNIDKATKVVQNSLKKRALQLLIQILTKIANEYALQPGVRFTSMHELILDVLKAEGDRLSQKGKALQKLQK